MRSGVPTTPTSSRGQADAWAADWRSWVAREHAPGRPNLYAVPGKRPAAPSGMTRAEAHTAALLAALDEPTGTE